MLYTIQHKDLKHLVYVGHTKGIEQFQKRINSHKSSSQNPLDVRYNSRLYNLIRTNGGWNMFVCKLVEQTQIETPINCEISSMNTRFCKQKYSISNNP
jgi:hypothetical protein